MRPSAPAPGVGAGDPPSCRPAGLPRFPKLPPTASLTARSTSLAQQLACPPLPAGLGPALPSGRLSTGIQPEEWGRETTAAWAQRPWAGSSLCPAHPAGGFQPQVTKGWGHCPTASPTLLGPLAGPFPSPPNGSYWGALPGPGSGRGWGSADQVDPPVQHLHVSTAPPWWQPRPRGLEGSCAPRAQESININHWGAGTFSPSQ